MGYLLVAHYILFCSLKRIAGVLRVSWHHSRIENRPAYEATKRQSYCTKYRWCSIFRSIKTVTVPPVGSDLTFRSRRSLASFCREEQMSSQQSSQMILVVDDEQAVCETIALTLRSRGYVVHTAYDGSDALRRLENVRLDLIISDLNMPGMSGFELISTIRLRFPGIPIVAMSAAYVSDCLPGNFSAFYAKGQGPQQLLSVVDELLSRQLNPGMEGGKRRLRRGRPAA